MCQLWTNPEQELISGYSLHEKNSYDTVKYQDVTLRMEGKPYEVEVLDEDLVRTSFFYPGLPAFTVVNPPGLRVLLSHLTWDEVCQKADGIWNVRQKLGNVRVKGPRDPDKFMIKNYDAFVKFLRRNHGTYIVKLTEENESRHVLFARRTPENLLDELQIAYVMEF